MYAHGRRHARTAPMTAVSRCLAVACQYRMKGDVHLPRRNSFLRSLALLASRSSSSYEAGGQALMNTIMAV